MLSDTSLNEFIRAWQAALNEHHKLGYPRANILWKAGRGDSRKMGSGENEDSLDVRVFVMALRDLGGEYPGFHRAFLAKYIDCFDGVVDHKPRKDKEKARRLGMSRSTFGRYIDQARFRLKTYLEEKLNT